ncbi:MAG: PEGA domain-containing protein, partial [Gemmatimonadales bacterium]
MRIRVALCSLLALASGGCATVFHGTTQAVPIVSQPAGAEVKVDGQSVGRTPVVVHVKRKNAHIVQFELAGFEPSRTTLNPQGSRAALWNLIAGTAYLGYLVDALTGGLYDLWPEVVAAPMRRTGADSVPPAPTDPAALAFGARVRVAPGPEAHGTVTGTLVRRTTDSLWIWPGRTAEAEAFPVRSVPQIDVSVGRHRNTGLGTLIGAVAGVPLGMAMASLAGCGVGWGG